MDFFKRIKKEVDSIESEMTRSSGNKEESSVDPHVEDKTSSKVVVSYEFKGKPRGTALVSHSQTTFFFYITRN